MLGKLIPKTAGTHPAHIPWTFFRGVSNSNAIKLTIFIPLVGYWILFNEKLLPYIELSRALTNGASVDTQAAAHVPLNLLCVYFGLCMIAAGSLLYQLFCPREIKQYASAADYVAQEREHISRQERLRISEFLKDTTPEYYDRFLKEGYGYGDHGVRTLVLEDERFLPDLMDFYFSHMNQYRAGLRAALLAFYGAGFTALAVPSLKIFIKVAALLFKSIA
ncbi:MAG: hypothetical protein DYH13_09905 [Alphaproteobacteria bacterium PRO2]|nr:hypothetical protein [Alphaproteobacteria bacterium PRO2]